MARGGRLAIGRLASFSGLARADPTNLSAAVREEAGASAIRAFGALAMPKLPGVNHLDAVRALEKAGFSIRRQGKLIVMTDGTRIVTIPRHNPINAVTLGTIVRASGLTIDQFRLLL